MHLYASTCTQIFIYTHNVFLTLDAVACSKRDLWGWLPLVLCVSDLILWFPLQTSTQHTDRETWGGGSKGERGRLKERMGGSKKAEIGKKRSGVEERVRVIMTEVDEKAA